MRLYVRCVSVSCALLMVSCTPFFGDVPIVDDPVIVAKVNACNGPSDGPKVASDYMQVGFANVYAACEAFFVNATRFQQNALATSNTLDAGLIGATSIVNATMSSAAAVKTITITTAGIVFGKAIVNDYVTIYTFGTHLYKVRQLVQSDLDNYAGAAAPPADTCIAYANVQKLATKCSLANMQALLDAQVAIPSQTVPTNSGAPPGGPPGMARAPRAYLRVSPPVGSTVVPIAQ
jgi:hypothetical protein